LLTTADGLFDNNVFSMATDDQGGLWVGSFGGVAYLKPKQ
jgi:ligand-binding sensor domain-containing protein